MRILQVSNLRVGVQELWTIFKLRYIFYIHKTCSAMLALLDKDDALRARHEL